MTIEDKKQLIEDNSEEEVKAYISIALEEYATVEGFEESRQGEYDSDKDFVQELLEDCGDILRDLPAYIHIDWETTVRDVMMDYSESNGYYFRKI